MKKAKAAAIEFTNSVQSGRWRVPNKRLHLFGALAFRKPPRKRQLNAWVAKFGLAPTSESQDRYFASFIRMFCQSPRRLILFVDFYNNFDFFHQSPHTHKVVYQF